MKLTRGNTWIGLTRLEWASLDHIEAAIARLCTLQTIDGLGLSASNTVVLAVPVEIMEIVNNLKEALKTRTSP